MAITNASRLADFGSGIGTAGAALKIDNSSNEVGIGTTNPNATLTVGNIGASGTSIYVHGDGRIVGVLTATKFSGGWDGALSISDATASTSSSTGALIVSGGVGIAKSLFVGEGVSVAGTITYADVTNVDSVGVVTAGKGVVVTGAYPITLGTGTTIHQVASNTLTLGTNNAERMRITSGGNVGIGTASPEDLLHISDGASGTSETSNAQLVLESGASTNYIVFQNPNTQNAGIKWSDAGGQSNALINYDHNTDDLWIGADDDIKLATAGSERMRIASDGKASFTGIVTATKFSGPGNIPGNVTTGTYTIVAADAGKLVSATGTVTLPAATFEVGDAISVYNNTGSNMTLTCSAPTAVYLGTDGSTVTSLTLALRCICTFVCVDTASNDTFVATGGGLS